MVIASRKLFVRIMYICCEEKKASDNFFYNDREEDDWGIGMNSVIGPVIIGCRLVRGRVLSDYAMIKYNKGIF